MTTKKNEVNTHSFVDKVYIPGEINKIRIGMCQIQLTDTISVKPDGTQTIKSNSPVTIYDTAGPYSDNTLKTSLKEGIFRIREEWYGRRKDIFAKKKETCFQSQQPVFRAKEGKQITQMYYAKKRIITPEMEYVAIRENQHVETLGLKSFITPDFVRKEIASGRAIIPANINHPEVEPMIIGRRFLVKINTNISSTGQTKENNVKKMIACCRLGTDTLMDLSTGSDCSLQREWLIRNCPVPIGTTPLYQALAKAEGKPENLSWELFSDTLIEQARQGVDFVAIHAAIRKKHLKLVNSRLTDFVSRSGIILSQWMQAHREENFLYTHFNEICEILKTYDISMSLGSGLRSGCIYDANDRAQLAEFSEMRNLVEMAWNQFIQTMAEGPGHVPMNKIETNIKEHQYLCKGAPYFSLGITTTDIAGKYDHVASAIGSAQIAWHGASLISGCVLKEDNTYLDNKETQDGIIAHKIAAHVADLAKGHPGAQVRDNALSKAYKEGRTDDVFRLSIDSQITTNSY